ncbi:rhodanese-like domain-containing protein [Proteus sp. FME41]|uniref:rhodanese-like domain-containing protein n=1 Tax=Proteus sp. FME41 TaxID=2742608 RepID=UPI001868EE6F|nr:rhodanese-like domain-containing protein [Proteus sp. FME41]
MLQEVMQFFNRHTLLSFVWVALLVAVIVLTFKGLFSKTKNISRTEAISLINKENAVCVDIRSRDEFRKGHIIDSINLTPSEIKSNNIAELEKYKSQPVIVVSPSGIESAKPAESLIKLGFEKVFILKDGLSGWSGENLPLAKGKK